MNVTQHAAGIFIGLNDKYGSPIHIGDELEFDEKEYGCPCRFIISLESGEITGNGCSSDWTDWCHIVSPWNLNFEKM